MGSIRQSISQTESKHLMRRLVSALPTSKYEMETLTRLADVKASRNLPTAAVECTRRPRLLINPDFVGKYCERDEHLFLLVMHELWHVQLAHTRMYPRMTRLQNIALDAIINSGLMRQFPDPEYRGFFDAVNPPDKFPSCLLRPPEGWPYRPQYPDNVGPPGTKEMIERLYPPGNVSFYAAPMYEEVLSLLLKAGMKWIDDDYMLLGNHDPRPMHDPLMKDFMKEVTAKWANNPMRGNGGGTQPARRRYRVTDGSQAMQRVFANTLRVCLAKRPGRQYRKARMPIASMTGNGVIPNARDRMAPARRRLGAPQTLWAQPGTVKARLPEKPSRAFVYLDVSGSMFMCLNYLLGLLLPYVANKQAEVFQFSTMVTELSFADLRDGQMTTTGGTNINPVLEHLTQVEPSVDQVLILTDGAVGYPLPELKDKVREMNPKIVVILPHDGYLNPGMNELVSSIVQLPSMY